MNLILRLDFQDGFNFFESDKVDKQTNATYW